MQTKQMKQAQVHFDETIHYDEQCNDGHHGIM